MDRSLEIGRGPIVMMEQAAQQIEKCLIKDNSAPTLPEQLNIHQQSGATASGFTDHDYPVLNSIDLTSATLTQVKTLCKVPLPTEIMENFGHMQCHCMMGLFPEVDRAWLTIDSDIYLWMYEKGNDVAYYDGLNDTIISVGLATPKAGVFQSFIKYLLVLTTASDIIVLGVTFTGTEENPTAEIQLVPDPVFSVPTEGAVITTIAGTSHGRLFLGGKDGSLFEISYQAETSWFGKRFKKINHSQSNFSFLMPSFINAALSDVNGIVQIAIDNSRNILYTLTEKGTIEVYDLGANRNSFSRVARLNQSQLVQMAVNTVKTLDSQNFRPIISISPVELSESSQINLVAISQSGTRFYLTTTGKAQQPSIRPYCLTLSHVRLPPGFSANMTTRPRNVHMGHYKSRNLILLSSVTENDTLWCISSDLFPFSPSLMEVHTTVSLDGPALAVAEVPYEKYPQRQLPDPPSIVSQHIEPPKKYVVLTSQGAHVFLKLRPVDLLRQILLESRGLDTDVIKNFFTVLLADQACATSLILACLEDPQNSDVAEYATRAFFLFGGEPRLAPLTGHQQNIHSTLFMPNIMSTPAPYSNIQNMQNQNLSYSSYNPQFQNVGISPNTSQFEPFQYSSKHNGLYFYLERILRPIWNMLCVEKNVAQNIKKVYLSSTITSTDCILTLSHLNSLRNFVMKNTQLSTYNNQNSRNNNPNQTDQTINPVNVTQNYTLYDAQMDEKHSLDAFKTFINHACQVVGLWKILCEHQFHILAESLPEQHKQMLQNAVFKDLILFGKDLCSMFITILVNSYLGDNASVDSISIKLRDICPDLYKMEDATISKANEILKSARNLQNIDEKEDLIVSALDLCKSVVPDINLSDICHQFIGLKAYNAVIELCVLCANKIDQKNIAGHFYKNSEQGDQEGYRFYTKRMEIYQYVINMLNSIFVPQDSINQTLANTSGIQNVSGVQEETHVLLHKIIDEILQYSDELLHVAIYEWMISKNMTDDIINVKNTSLETYLQKVAQESPNNINVYDLLWKYYENNNNHTSAAKILNSLASKPGNLLSLQDRMSYLARAVMCMRSDKVGYVPYLGVFLRELEDKIDIAKVQEQILDAMTNLKNSIPNAEDAIIALNSGLYEITQLYENFAEPFHLWESKLAIIDCAGYSDPKFVEEIWNHIIEDEVQKYSGSGNDRMIQILSKIKILARQYKLSSNCFPLQHIILNLEMISAQLKTDSALVANLFLSIEIPIEMLINIYNRLITTTVTERFWTSEENEFHFYYVIAVLMNAFLRTHQSYNSVDKRKLIALCQDTTATILSNLYSKPNTERLINILKGIQAQLSRL
nr:nuclear pore complex protein Nup155 [Onthophagus taurus]XP_022900277.1 nuclear pore complex protein Nup155 [Onthophagus taurus]